MLASSMKLVASGDQVAADRPLDVHGERLKGMVQLRMDHRLRARFDPSDVVQEALIRASEPLTSYCRERPMPFYPWLRNIAGEQLVRYHQQHLAGKRTFEREQHWRPHLSDESVSQLADRLATSASGSSEKLVKKEIRHRTRAALELLTTSDREVVELRYLEHLDNTEIAAILEITPGAVRTRHFRAVRRLHYLLSDDSLKD